MPRQNAFSNPQFQLSTRIPQKKCKKRKRNSSSINEINTALSGSKKSNPKDTSHRSSAPRQYLTELIIGRPRHALRLPGLPPAAAAAALLHVFSTPRESPRGGAPRCCRSLGCSPLSADGDSGCRAGRADSWRAAVLYTEPRRNPSRAEGAGRGIEWAGGARLGKAMRRPRLSECGRGEKKKKKGRVLKSLPPLLLSRSGISLATSTGRK